jgi:hypothetical protein
MCCGRNEQERWERLLARFEEEDRLRELAGKQEAAADNQEKPEREPELARA